MAKSDVSTAACPHCDASLDYLSRGCAECGQRVPWEWTEPCLVCDSEVDYTDDRCPDCRTRLSVWDGIVARVLRETHHVDFHVAKDAVPHPKSEGFVRHTGDPRGQYADYRRPELDGRGIHVKEYRDRFHVHWDKVDPTGSRRAMWNHVLVDAPHWLLVGGFLAFKFARYPVGLAAYIKR
ncbi:MULTISPECIES: hypothetical protein [Halorussus]|uniref:hypothetical protein n=1 Tax=Halorussus TaxID=1070314 RepID=UPI00209EDD53|nr:hypothetical protein [Halorussus vallis]USZ74077.1 hypothetical protein NGM07_11485 [Halorussus vallis]